MPTALFDLERDPRERRDLLATRRDLASRLQGSISRRLENERRLASLSEEPRAVDSEIEERLRSLGYTD